MFFLYLDVNHDDEIAFGSWATLSIWRNLLIEPLVVDSLSEKDELELLSSYPNRIIGSWCSGSIVPDSCYLCTFLKWINQLSQLMKKGIEDGI